MSNELVAQHRATKHNDMIHQESTSQQKHNHNKKNTKNKDSPRKYIKTEKQNITIANRDNEVALSASDGFSKYFGCFTKMCIFVISIVLIGNLVAKNTDQCEWVTLQCMGYPNPCDQCSVVIVIIFVIVIVLPFFSSATLDNEQKP